METTINDRFAVVQEVYQLEDWQAAASLLIEVLGLPAITAKQQARKSHGYLAVKLQEASAHRLRDACAGRGIAVHVIPQSDVIPVIKPLRVHQVGIAADGLLVQSPGSDSKTRLDWNALRLIAATKTTKTESFRHWETTGNYGRTSEVKLKVTSYTEDCAEYLADVFALRPHGGVVAVRLYSRELNYAEALGDMAPDALVVANARTDGFRMLVSAIAAHAPEIYVPPESLTLLSQTAKESVRTPRLSLDEFDALNRWTLQRLVRQGVSRDEGLREANEFQTRSQKEQRNES